MQFKNRNGVLGLDTAKQVIVTFLILAVVGIAILLALTSLQSATTSSGIDTSTAYDNNSVVNESFDGEAQGGWINLTGYTLSSKNTSTEQFIILHAWNQTSGDEIPADNYTIGFNTGIVTNTTSVAPFNNWNNVTFDYVYLNVYTYDNGRTTAIVGNVSGGIVTFFGSTGTIFSILVVVVIILAISIIIWAVGRFGQNTADNQSVNL